MNDNCIFCKIVKGESHSLKIYEDENTLSFMDIAGDVDGHILVIPKKHYTNILDIDNEALCHVMNTVKKISNHLVDKCGYNGINLLNANDKSAGQSVFHYHIHIIPRKNNDGVRAWPKLGKAKHKIEEMHQKLKMIE